MSEMEKSINEVYVSLASDAKNGIRDIQIPSKYLKQNTVQARPDEIEMHKILQEESKQPLRDVNISADAVKKYQQEQEALAQDIVNSMTQSNEQALVQGRGI